MNSGVGAEIAASIQEGAFLRLEAPVKRVTGWDTHTGLVYEKFNLPDVASKWTSFIARHIEGSWELTYCRRNLRCHQANAQLLDYH